jgi:hypothetical protein
MKSSSQIDERLLELSQRLIRGHDIIAQGSVLRCLARATREARAWGRPPQHHLSTVEAATRWHLAQRVGSAASKAPTSVPRPRQGGSAGETAGP